VKGALDDGDDCFCIWTEDGQSVERQCRLLRITNTSPNSSPRIRAVTAN
jgi:hypothetical protein